MGRELEFIKPLATSLSSEAGELELEPNMVRRRLMTDDIRRVDFFRRNLLLLQFYFSARLGVEDWEVEMGHGEVLMRAETIVRRGRFSGEEDVRNREKLIDIDICRRTTVEPPLFSSSLDHTISQSFFHVTVDIVREGDIRKGKTSLREMIDGGDSKDDN
ncbi:hypothetical protein L2E82_02533 [Cichorium intybus]|uniref:Uncharacterized protein n=1 Tax=Cichorium intybus TaxID=13427 RepID=A0ACB9H303_CICIN|nr:hypothetical protein L2E82_02533 [Cichorium intybus]